MTAFCEGKLIDGSYCIRPEKHRGPHENWRMETNADIRKLQKTYMERFLIGGERNEPERRTVSS